MDQEPEIKEEITDESLPDDALPVCPGCFEPCDPLTFYCPNCGSNETINPLASYLPFVRLRFNVGMIVNILKKLKFSNGWLFLFWLIAFCAAMFLLLGGFLNL